MRVDSAPTGTLGGFNDALPRFSGKTSRKSGRRRISSNVSLDYLNDALQNTRVSLGSLAHAEPENTGSNAISAFF
jgi:hypothetical protein